MKDKDDIILNDFEIDRDLFDDLKSFDRYEHEYKLRKQKLKVLLIFVATLMYSLFAFYMLTKGLPSSLNNFKLIVRQEVPAQKNQNILEIDNRLSLVEKNLKNFVDNATSSVSVADLQGRLSVMENVVLDNPEKAMTSVMLREQQKDLESQLFEIKQSQAKLEDKLNTIIIAPIILAIIGVIISVFTWLFKNFIKKQS